MDKESIYLLENFTTWIVSSVFESGSRFRSFGEGRNHDEPFPFRTMARHFRAHRVDFACSQIHGTIIDGDRPLEGSSAALSKVQRAGCSTRGTSHVRFAKAASLFISESCAANVKINETRGEGYKRTKGNWSYFSRIHWFLDIRFKFNTLIDTCLFCNKM